jgi:endonuclease III related protein
LNARSPEETVRLYYRTLLRAWGPQHWWPARTPFEVIVGAYLTQNTAWTNVEQALRRLRSASLLSLPGIRRVSLAKLETLIRPAGYFRQKAQRLKNFVAFVDQNYGGSLRRMFARPTEPLRDELLALNGVGPETADSILLYAGNHAVFVVDAYTRRILTRHNLLPDKASYEDLRNFFQGALTPLRVEIGERGKQSSFAHSPSPMSAAPRSGQAQVYNEMHGLIVVVGKHYCAKAKPLCDQCPLRPFLPQDR